MIFYALNIFSIVTSILCRAEDLALPVTTCKRNSTDYSTCLKVALEESWPQFLEGLPEFDFPRLNPFLYKYTKFVFNRNGIYGEIIGKNITLFGLPITRFLDVRPHFLDDVFRLEIDIQIPRVFAHGYATGEINLLGIRGSGTGQVNLTINEIRQTWHITGHVKNDTWTIEHFQITITIERMKVHLSGFFDDSKEFTDLLEAFINEYWPPIFRVVTPVVIEVLDPMLTDLTNRLFSKVSFSEVFL
ncbi:unnamed protein product [Lasius platythorax]|uniref:Circadian clock-controlled protein n=1 Tax=Lasius platythorax TaxID=488582 RepID=A0AAV2P544_9HYME